MKILFVDPRGWQGAAKGQRPYANVGLAYLSGALKAHAHEVHVVDFNNHEISDEDLLAEIKDFAPDLIGFSAKTSTMSSVRELACAVKQAGILTPVIVGGPHTSLAPMELLNDYAFDGILIGEGEFVLPSILDAIKDGKKLDQIDGIITKNKILSGSELIKNMLNNIEEIEFPDYSVFSEKVQQSLIQNYPLVTTRGCVYKCIFCSVPEISGKKFRYRSPESVVKELRHAVEYYKITSFEIIDDIFNLNLLRCKDICRKIIESNLNLSFTCANGIRADKIDQELADLMFRAGCYHACVGVESGDSRVFSGVNKGETLDDIRRGIKYLKNAGIKVTGFFIVGLPDDSIEAALKSVKFARDTKIDPFFNMLIPYPGTKIYDWVNTHGRILSSIENGFHFNNDPNTLNIVFDTKDFPIEDKKYAWELVHLKLYQWHRIFPSSMHPIRKMIKLIQIVYKYDKFNMHYYVSRALYDFIKLRVSIFKKLCSK